jgi:hypothetical protein
MSYALAPCLICGHGNTQSTVPEEAVEFIDLERDVNWNDPAIVCTDCAVKIGALAGMISPDAIDALKSEAANDRRKRHEAEARLDEFTKKARRIGIEFKDAA